RKPGGFQGSTQDTDDNNNDFRLITSDPQNLNSGPTPGSTPTPTPTPTTTPTPTPTPTPIPLVVISQIFGGGGNSGAPYKNDFIELFNRGTTTTDITAWSVQYASASATSWSTTPLCPSGTCSLAPGQYFLIQESGGANGSSLPAPDAT